jgi:RimJ/RimL family protein N-acetyltransferase
MAHKHLETERFDLRPMAEADAPLLADLGADPDVVKTLICDWSTAERRHEIAKYWIEKNQEFGIWGVHDREGAPGEPGRFVGFVGADEPLPTVGLGPEIYYAFAQETWGKGVATEAVRAVIEHLIRDQGVAAVEALILSGLNPASTRLAERLGMTLVGRYSLADYAGSECGPTIGYEVWRVETASREKAQVNLEEAAFKIGQFVADGVETKAAAAAALKKAARANGLAARMGDESLGHLIDARLAAGMADSGWLHYRLAADSL